MQNIPNCFYRISIKALILDSEKRFLLTKEENGKWELPGGGGLDFGENFKDCLKREIKEEMGLDITFVADTPSYFVTAKRDNREYWLSSILYVTKVKDLNFTPSDECVELRFFNKEEALKENLFSTIVEFVKLYNPENH